MLSPQPIRWGIIGIGRFGRLHVRAVQSIYGLELAAICNRNRDCLEEAQAEISAPRAMSDFRELLDDPSIDAISITTHWQDHYEVASAALASGKHVLLEKPMAATSEECRQLVELSQGSPGKFMVGHICRFDPRVTLAKQAIAEGRIGRIVSMHAKRNLPQAKGSLRLDKTSPLMGDGIHDADLMMWFLGRAPTRVYGRYVRFNEFRYPDVGWAMLEFDDSAIGVVETNWGLPANTPTVIDASLQVVGTDGMLTIDCSHTGLTILDASGLKMQDTDYWPEQHGSLVGILQNEIAYFADCIRHNRTPDVITPAEAALAVSVMEAAERSAAGTQPVELP
ncbi:MAG: Gfo/Idh/MocA family oxidoreductase [Planctomycetia bacterium]|nr:Gfo/Idh/MocA family oxidoreductase [Planctomycetia bacterium]